MSFINYCMGLYMKYLFKQNNCSIPPITLNPQRILALAILEALQGCIYFESCLSLTRWINAFTKYLSVLINGSFSNVGKYKVKCLVVKRM